MSLGRGVLSKACKHSKLLGQIFLARTTIQPLSSFTEEEQKGVEELLNEGVILKKDSDDNIWLNKDIEVAFALMQGAQDTISLGRMSEDLEDILEAIRHHQEKANKKYVYLIVKTFTDIGFSLEGNATLVTKRRESNYGGTDTHSARIRYLERLLGQTKRLNEEADSVLAFINVHKRAFISFYEVVLNRKITEIRIIVGAVKDTLLIEIERIEILLKEARIKKDQDEVFKRRIKMIEYLLDKKRLFSETNILEVMGKIPSTASLEVSTHLNSRYADSEEYRERILEKAKKRDASIKQKKVTRKTKKANRVDSKERVKEVNYIDTDEVYTTFMQQDKPLLEFLNTIDLSLVQDEIVDVYLAIYSNYGDAIEITVLDYFVAIPDGNHEIRQIIPVKGA